MAGIYIHVPFCKKACHYCNFHFSTSLGLKDAFVEAILKEIKLSASRESNGETYLRDEIIETIYFGGGTPSLLENDELNKILSELHKYYNIDTTAEITLEANPDDINIQKLREWKSAGINRLSIGIQSFFNEHLTWMNRAHTAGQAFNSLKWARREGFDNISIDLIYGTPGLQDDQWKHNVQLATDMGIPHLSCYALTVEPSTALQKMIQLKKSADVDPDKQAAQFLMLVDWADEAGYEHYEISNFAKPGKRSRHNSGYWLGKKYLGFGPSAHSFNGVSRQWNISNNALYIQSLTHNIPSVEKEILTPVQRLNEYIMTSLRTMEGINISYVETRFGKEAAGHIMGLIQKYKDDGKIYFDDGMIVLTREGKLYADGIAADFFR